jgi:hypothetical protein
LSDGLIQYKCERYAFKIKTNMKNACSSFTSNILCNILKTVVEKKEKPPAAANNRNDRVAGQRRRRGADMMRRRMQEQDEEDEEGLWNFG